VPSTASSAMPYVIAPVPQPTSSTVIPSIKISANLLCAEANVRALSISVALPDNFALFLVIFSLTGFHPLFKIAKSEAKYER